MRLHKKISFIKKYIHNNQEYLDLSQTFNYTIENYIEVTNDLVTDDLKWKMELFGGKTNYIKAWFTNNETILLDKEYVLSQYAEFLMYMHYKVLKEGLILNDDIRLMHTQQYDLHSQRNFWNYRKKFYLA